MQISLLMDDREALMTLSQRAVNAHLELVSNSSDDRWW